MADLSITAANVVPGAGAVLKTKTAGEAITAGQPIVKNPSTGAMVKSDADHATAALREVDGIAVNSAAAGQPVTYQTEGELAFGAVFTANTPVYLSGTAGGICPIADVGSGEYLVQLGIPKSTTTLILDIKSTGVAN